MSRRRDICVCARAYTVPPGRWRARSVRAETGHYGRTGQFSARMSKGKRFGWFRVKNLHTARPTVTLRCGTEATYPLRWRSRTPARRGPAGRRPARHPAVAGSKTRRRSRRRSREVRQIPRVIRPRFARDLISLLHSFRPGCRERRGRAGRVRETTRARRTCSSLDSSDDSLPSVDRGA
jgi:hypothetical protein